MIVVANFGMGNYKSVKNMINFLDYDCEIWEQPKKSSSISHLILPGVGAFDAGMWTIHPKTLEIVESEKHKEFNVLKNLKFEKTNIKDFSICL